MELRPNTSADAIGWEDKLFLAGTIEMGKSEDWQAKAVEYFKDERITVYNPRVAKWNKDMKQDITCEAFTHQVTWEQKYLHVCNYIIVNLLGDSLSPITLLELGALSKEQNKTIVICCPREYWRRGNIQIVCILNKLPLYEVLEEGMAHIRVLLQYKKA